MCNGAAGICCVGADGVGEFVLRASSIKFAASLSSSGQFFDISRTRRAMYQLRYTTIVKCLDFYGGNFLLPTA